MPYTLTMGLLWFAAAFVVGLVTGILVRSVVARRQIAAARASAPAAPSEPPAVPVTPVAPASPEPADDEHGAGRATTNGNVTHAAPHTAGHIPAGPTAADAETVLGRPVIRDDLTLVEGLGPQVAELCHGIGIASWRDLADTEVSLLRTMLDDAGARYQVHDPTTWPAQAQLLAEGRWVEFRDTVAAIRAGSSGST